MAAPITTQSGTEPDQFIVRKTSRAFGASDLDNIIAEVARRQNRSISNRFANALGDRPLLQTEVAAVALMRVQGIRSSEIAQRLNVPVRSIQKLYLLPAFRSLMSELDEVYRDEVRSLVPLAVARLEEALESSDRRAHRWAVDQVFKASGISQDNTNSTERAADIAHAFKEALMSLVNSGTLSVRKPKRLEAVAFSSNAETVRKTFDGRTGHPRIGAGDGARNSPGTVTSNNTFESGTRTRGLTTG